MASDHEVSLETPILYLKSEEAFAGLTSVERKFAHYLSRASWWGGFIVACQRSPESPTIFCLLIRLFRSQPIDSLKEIALAKGNFTEDEFKYLQIYFSTFLYNMGNYFGFGDKKFIPSFPREKFERLIRASKAYLESPDLMENYMNSCLDLMYSIDENQRFLALPSQGITMYFTPNCSDEDAKLVNEYMEAKSIEAWSTRLLKHEKDGESVFDIRYASIEKDPCPGITMEEDAYEGKKFKISRGDYSFFLKKFVNELEKSKAFVSNDLEKNMIEKYIGSFTTGCIKTHKDASSFWVKNKSPAVETYMGFIEVYTDPTQQRAEFESFVAIVNREQSKKFDTLVDRAETEFLPLLPWGLDFEDAFSRPDFSALDILTFATAGLPIGINIPNYKDIKEEVGFKNVSLANVMSARAGDKTGPFLSEEDHAIKEKYGALSLEVQVALHELLGHGCGKFLRRKDDGSLNFDPSLKNPLTGETVTFYEKGQNYNTVFTDISSAYEECRAETVAIYLGLIDEILDIFAVDDNSRDNVKYLIWLSMMYSGLRGLEMYQPSRKSWGQAHSQARYVILRVALEAGEGLVNITETKGSDGLPDLRLTLDRSKIETVGKKKIGEFLKKMQIYRSTADIKSAREMFEGYSNVPEDGPYPFAKWHEIVIRKRRPRMILTMPNSRLVGDDVELISYSDGAEGKINSFLERFSSEEYNEIEEGLYKFANTWTQ